MTREDELRDAMVGIIALLILTQSKRRETCQKNNQVAVD
jgi:hypothetical protein